MASRLTDIFDTDLPVKVGFSMLVLASILVAILLIRRVIRRRLEGRLQRLEEIKQFDAVQTESPMEDPLRYALGQARKSIRSRYSVINMMATVSLLGIGSIIAIFPTLEQMPKAMVSLCVAIAGAVLGIAAKPFVENLISGVVISFSSQLKIGDTVLLDEKHYGTVEDINITHTVIKLWDWRRQIVPNTVMLQKDFTNLSHRDSYIWTYVEFHIDYDADMNIVERIAVEAAEASEYLAGYETPQVWVQAMRSATVVVWVAAWAKSPEAAWVLRADIRRGLIQGFRANGIHSQLERVNLAGGISPSSSSV